MLVSDLEIFSGPSANDACDNSNVTIALTNVDNINAVVFFNAGTVNGQFPVGNTILTFTATDLAGNATTCTMNVTINDNTPPVITGCPEQDIVRNVDNGACGALVTWTPPTISDNCVAVSTNSTHNPGDFFQVGSTSVTYTALDAAGNQSTCTFNVTVNDNELPNAICNDITGSIRRIRNSFNYK